MHVAIIMNGNGRWAMTRGLPPTAGCMEGAAALRTTVELALRAGVKTLLPAGAADLLIHTGGGKCRSNFMLWEVAYARLHYPGCLWSDFSARHFQRAPGELAARH